MPLDPQTLRRYAVARTLFAPTTLGRAITRLGFVQADPIRQPARAQDLILRHRVRDYHAGDLERRYARLPIEEDFFINHGYLPRATQRLMHPRTARHVWPAATWTQARAVLDFVRERGIVHPRDVDAHFQHGRTTNWFGGTSNASTQLLDGMQYRGLLRIAGRASGVRLYAACGPDEGVNTKAHDADAALDTLVDELMRCYAPVPESSLGFLMSFILGGTPQWRHQRAAALKRAKARLASDTVDGARWYWPASEKPRAARWHRDDDRVRLLAPFDPIVWDRHRFEQLWGWPYRFEAYVPAPKRQRGYYAMPLLWRQHVIGWGNLATRDGTLDASFGYVSGRAPRDRAFKREHDAEVERMRAFLGLANTAAPSSR